MYVIFHLFCQTDEILKKKNVMLILGRYVNLKYKYENR